MNFPRGLVFQNKSQLSNLQNGHREKLFFNSPFLTISKPLERSEIMSSHQKSVTKAFFLYELPQGVLFCQNKSQLSNLQNGHREKLFFNSPFLTISKPPERSEIMSSHQKSVKKAFFLYELPQGVLFCQNKSQLSNLQNGHREKLFFNSPFLTISKPLERSEIMSSHQKSVKKAFFLYELPQGVLFCQTKSQLSNLQNRHREKFSLNHPFLTISKPLGRSEIMSSHQKGIIKAFFFHMTSHQGALLLFYLYMFSPSFLFF